MARAYHCDQTGAPALSYSTAINNIAHFTALKSILKACLVSGYGSQPAAGWELIAEGTKYLILRNGSHTGYVCFTFLSGATRIYLSETYDGVSGDVIVGEGVRTGKAANNATPHVINSGYLAYSAGATSWSMVADERTFVLSILSTSANVELVTIAGTAGHYAGVTLLVGEDSAGHFIAVGGVSSTGTTGDNSGIRGYFSAAEGFTALRSPATGLLIGSGSLVAVTPSLRQVTATYNAVYPLQRVNLSKIPWFGDGVYAGDLRGVCLAPELVETSYASYAGQSLGRSGPMYVRDGGAPIDLGDGHAYFARLGHYLAPFFLLTDAPEYW